MYFGVSTIGFFSSTTGCSSSFFSSFLTSFFASFFPFLESTFFAFNPPFFAPVLPLLSGLLVTGLFTASFLPAAGLLVAGAFPPTTFFGSFFSLCISGVSCGFSSFNFVLFFVGLRGVLGLAAPSCFFFSIFSCFGSSFLSCLSLSCLSLSCFSFSDFSFSGFSFSCSSSFLCSSSISSNFFITVSKYSNFVFSISSISV